MIVLVKEIVGLLNEIRSHSIQIR